MGNTDRNVVRPGEGSPAADIPSFKNIAQRDTFFGESSNSILLETGLPVIVNQGNAITVFIWTGEDNPTTYDPALFVEQALNSGSGTLYLGLDGTNLSSAGKSVNFESAYGDKALAVGNFFSEKGSIRPLEFRFEKEQIFTIADVFDTQLSAPRDFTFTITISSYTQGFFVRPATAGKLTVKGFAGPTANDPIILDKQITISSGDIGNIVEVLFTNGLLGTPLDVQFVVFDGVDLFGGLQTSGEFSGQTKPFLQTKFHVVDVVHLLGEDDLDQYVQLNHDHTTAAVKNGGVSVATLPTDTTDTFTDAEFTAGVASTSNPTLITDGLGTFASGDLVLIVRCTDLLDSDLNDGLYEVSTHVGTTLTVKGVGTVAATEDFVFDQFIFLESTGTITKVGVSVLRFTDTDIQQGFGNTTPIVFRSLGVSSKQYIFTSAGFSDQTARTAGRVDVYLGESTTSEANDFTAAIPSTSPPLITIADLSTFVANDLILVTGTSANNGLYEVQVQLGFVIFCRGIGATEDNVEDFTRDQVVTATESGTVRKVNVSVHRTSLTGTTEHGEGNQTPITFFRLAHVDDVPIIATEEFASTNARFFGELGLPATQGWTETATGSTTIDLVAENVFGVSKEVVRINDNFSDGIATIIRALTAQNWVDINAFGASYSGVTRLDSTDGANGFFSGLQADAAENPLATGDRRYGILFNDDAGNLRLTEADNTGNNVTMDGTLGNPSISFDEWFAWECIVPAGLGAAQFYINGSLITFVPTFLINGGGLGTKAVIGSGSTGGVDRITYHDNFGVTIYEDSNTKTLLASSMAADVLQVFVPGGKRDYTVILPDGNPRNLGGKIDLVLRNINGKLKLKTENVSAPQAVFNGLNEIEKNISSVQELSFVNTVASGNVYIGKFEEFISYEHSGLISTGEIGSPQGMSILSDDTFRLEKIHAVIVDRAQSLDFPKQTDIKLPQTDHTITGGGDQVINAYINRQGIFEFRTDEPTIAAITDEIFVGKAVMAAGVITVAVFTPVVAYNASVDVLSELINRGGQKTTGSIISAGGANLTLSITAGSHQQLGRGLIVDPNAPNSCDTGARAVIAFTGTLGNLFLVHVSAGGGFIIDSFISNSANPDIDPTTYNPAGTLVTVPVNDVTAKRVYQACDTNDIIVYSGTVAYANMAAAEAGFQDENPEILTTKDISYICTILVKETVTDLTDGVVGGDVIFKNRSGKRPL